MLINKSIKELSSLLRKKEISSVDLVRESYKTPIETYSINVMGTVHLLETCRHTKSVKAILNVTTDKCYENREWLWGYLF